MLHATIDGCCTDAYLAEMVYLVLHQGYERRDDETRPLHGHCRHLESDGFAATSRHQSQCVVTSTNGFDDITLNAAEVIVAPILSED